MDVSDLRSYCESPIERQLLDAICAELEGEDTPRIGIEATSMAEYSESAELGDAPVQLGAQVSVTGDDESGSWRFRPDFLLVCGVTVAYRRAFAIECDGHEWHEKTKDQVARDKLRDRRLILAGVTPIRFSGAEIFHTPSYCARYVIELAHAAYGAVAAEEFKSTLGGPGFKG